MRNRKKILMAGGLLAISGVAMGACTVAGYGSKEDFPRLNEPKGIAAVPEKKEAPKKVENPLKKGEKADVELEGTQVTNERPDRAAFLRDYCANDTKLKSGAGLKDKGGTCLPVVIGEIAKNPVRVAAEKPPTEVAVGKGFELGVLVADKNGPLDLNAFTADETGKAGKTFLEHPGELLENGSPLAHCHIGVTTLDKNGFPGENYDAAFSGVQGLKGDLKVKVGALNPGKYRADVFCSQPGHLILPTNVADRVQAFDTFRFEVK